MIKCDVIFLRYQQALKCRQFAQFGLRLFLADQLHFESMKFLLSNLLADMNLFDKELSRSFVRIAFGAANADSEE